MSTWTTTEFSITLQSMEILRRRQEHEGTVSLM